MKVSELIDGLENVLKNEGDLDVFYSMRDEINKQITSIPLECGGIAPIGEDQTVVAFVGSLPADQLLPEGLLPADVEGLTDEEKEKLSKMASGSAAVTNDA